MPKLNKGARLERNGSGIYEIRWTESRRSKRKSTGTSDLAVAQEALAKHLLDDRKDRVAPTSVRAMLDAYMSEHVRRKSVAVERQEDCVEVLSCGLGSLDVSQLTPSEIIKYSEDRKSGKINGRSIGDGTLRRELNCLVAAINHAVRNRRLAAADAPHVALPEAPPPKDVWLTEGQLEDFVDASSRVFPGERMSRIHRFVVIASETAARKTSVQTLRWEQVDFDARLVNFQNDGSRRTKKRKVPVPMSDALEGALRRAWRERTQNEWVLDTPYSIQHHFEMLVKMAGAGFEDVTPHVLRHTWATHAARAGVPLFEIAGVLGDTLATVMRVYAHHCPDHLRGAVNFRTTSSTARPSCSPA